MNEATRIRLRRAVRNFYDLQRLRIQCGNRDSDRAELTDDDRAFMANQSTGLGALEEQAMVEIRGILKGIDAYRWLKAQKGCGPTMAAVLLSEVDITRAETASALWKYAGLDVDTATGQARRSKKGEKRCWNSFLKAKCVGVLADCLLRANSPWRTYYDNYKHRKQSLLLPKCMGCGGTGKVSYSTGTVKSEERAVIEETPASVERTNRPPGQPERAETSELPNQSERAGRHKPPDSAEHATSHESTITKKRANALEPLDVRERATSHESPESEKLHKCPNCSGTGGPAPWGRSDAHRHRAALRYMTKMFLLEFWREWRTLEGLPTPNPYAEAKLGVKHGEHATTP